MSAPTQLISRQAAQARQLYGPVTHTTVGPCLHQIQRIHTSTTQLPPEHLPAARVHLLCSRWRILLVLVARLSVALCAVQALLQLSLTTLGTLHAHRAALSTVTARDTGIITTRPDSIGCLNAGWARQKLKTAFGASRPAVSPLPSAGVSTAAVQRLHRFQMIF